VIDAEPEKDWTSTLAIITVHSPVSWVAERPAADVLRLVMERVS
jgi:hypothetical protein